MELQKRWLKLKKEILKTNHDLESSLRKIRQILDKEGMPGGENNADNKAKK
ncbi:MAG: hypothetical protein K2X86_14945 [Cytophagaceae bacterium]|nr:hypothetical protein [Cytophagaceae bacterium]